MARRSKAQNKFNKLIQVIKGKKNNYNKLFFAINKKIKKIFFCTMGTTQNTVQTPDQPSTPDSFIDHCSYAMPEYCKKSIQIRSKGTLSQLNNHIHKN